MCARSKARLVEREHSNTQDMLKSYQVDVIEVTPLDWADRIETICMMHTTRMWVRVSPKASSPALLCDVEGILLEGCDFKTKGL